jgi:hypothetical protein
MTDTPPSPQRRRVLGALASLPILGRAGSLSAAPAAFPPPPPQDQVRFPDGATVLVAGPSGGLMAQWARTVRPALAQSLAPGLPIHQHDVGGPDGVTGANQFDVRVTPDGRTVLLVPGDAVTAWLVGDPRAKFDVAHWVSVMVCTTPAVVVARPAAFASAGVIRVAAATPAGPNLPALLGIEMLGQRAQLVHVFEDERSLRDAFARNAVDGILLRGHHVPQRARTLAVVGAVPLFSLGAIDGMGRLVRCPTFPDLPNYPEFHAMHRGTAPGGPLFDAWRAAAIAAQLEFNMVLLPVTPADMVALWRQVGLDAAGALDVQAMAHSLAVRPLGGPEATATTSAVATNGAALTSLRRWLAERYNWHPV